MYFSKIVVLIEKSFVWFDLDKNKNRKHIDKNAFISYYTYRKCREGGLMYSASNLNVVDFANLLNRIRCRNKLLYMRRAV